MLREKVREVWREGGREGVEEEGIVVGRGGRG